MTKGSNMNYMALGYRNFKTAIFELFDLVS